MDASACESLLLPLSSGSLKHFETENLWVQEVIIQSNQTKVVKIVREVSDFDSL